MFGPKHQLWSSGDQRSESIDLVFLETVVIHLQFDFRAPGLWYAVNVNGAIDLRPRCEYKH